MIKYHAQLFKAAMVQAILRPVDPKTNTRRNVTFDNSITDGAVKRKEWHLLNWDKAELHSLVGIPVWHVPFHNYSDKNHYKIVRVRPRVMPGDRLWVRETWRYYKGMLSPGSIVYRADEKGMPIHYPWTPSIHMPRWASRIDLDVLDVRSQRVQDISAMDAVAEGIKRSKAPAVAARVICEIKAFRELWDSINAKRGFPWVKNHPVWIYDFKRVK